VLHRQVQSLERKFGWAPREGLWTPFSWLVTIALVNFGWIFFRSNSISEAWQMFSAVFSLASYPTFLLSGSLYVLVFGLAAGYAIVLLVLDALDQHSTEPDGSRVLAMLARYRWFWIPPLYISILLLVVIITHSRGTDAAQFMYRNF
jgi:hypothetical protein